MNRKHFLTGIFGAGLSLPLWGPLAKAANKISLQQDLSTSQLSSTVLAAGIIPPYLQPGDLIGITCPAGYISRADIQPAVKLLQAWGFRIRVGSTVNARDHSFGGTDQARYTDLQAMLDDPEIKAIMCGRGGYGAARIVDRLDFSKFRQYPKWVIGFSDITVLHCHIHRHTGIASLHSKMCNSFPDDFGAAAPEVQQTILSIRQALTGVPMHYSVVPDPNNRPGNASGALIGGNLTMLQSVIGTQSEINTNGKILFLEEVGEYLYSLDRLFNSLQRAKKLDNLAGLVLCGFNRLKPDDPGEEFGRTLYDIVFEKVKNFRYPVCFNFPVGHQKNNYALKCGVLHQLRVQDNSVTLNEIG
ncbi:muramoyltetrapeptide carboxypeptidase [Chitinophaga costaii]|uniref:Muramoyltetrapeptide carboxypeptidase n=1 Tax=Chitinophaga costaii TaxID=1335309 RepID=A0A1C4C1M4_9BACT|nr:LD-carboxypeptidase [Chitinophaga costaii]PUZ27373.1 LD-carboxypeptidase [Chitinophaga costaii]SCC13019.1 muramoyltetrapeptide carboxypeptidase [Chitinophaga costaii]